MGSQIPFPTSTRTDNVGEDRQELMRRGPIRKFMQTIGPEMFQELKRISEEKGIHVQTLLRAVIIPEWMQEHGLSTRDIRTPEAHRSIGNRNVGRSGDLAIH